MVKCKETGCEIGARFNLINESNGLFCSEHRKDGMINIIDKHCVYKDCLKYPVYNFIGSKLRLYCYEHKLDGMINIKDKKCIVKDCKIRANFNFENESAKYCYEHRKDKMINVKSKKCKEYDCSKQPCYNLPDIKNGIYCAEHKKDGMINIYCKSCLIENCTTQPIYNYKNELNGIYCYTHKLEGMINVIDKRCLECDKIPNYNYTNENIGLYCYDHKKKNMINIKSKRCLTDNCTILISNPNYKGYCFYCFINLFPDEPVYRNYKTKECYITSVIKDTFEDEYTMIFDKKIENGCSQKRPDTFIDFGSHIVILEIDEQQHKDYSCENKREMTLFQDAGNRPMKIIRFNPDSYKSQNINIESCFKLLKTGVLTINKNEFIKRMDVLINHLKEARKPPEKEIEKIYLFYDE